MAVDNDGILAIFLGITIGLPLLSILRTFLASAIVVRHKEVVIVERWGRFHTKWGPGLHFLVPYMDKVKTITWRRLKIQMPHEPDALIDKSFYRVDARQTIMDFKLQTIITRDNVEIAVRPMVIYEFCDPMKVCYEVYDLSQAIKKLVQTTLRSIIGDMGLDDTLASREEINRGILQKISHICFNWGSASIASSSSRLRRQARCKRPCTSSSRPSACAGPPSSRPRATARRSRPRPKATRRPRSPSQRASSSASSSAPKRPPRRAS
ncbi:hypothetical protein SPRG_03215 [Saprolegnia parasitica CBS 223.65]|uniref:Band 7 domain-containing protein n=1 Tax=Saprolegnia parasitica (strain CBS 223.65) TaxID=695850 RepID=A0A067CNA0_SAPPC|nr:hypothetical protein SPRG_03215 [Saprolegnia parasitica CBS 223.65]KDO31998.1 hypothetical protein SPRG_03215 [Saprolegnia parasitica CBS 223.65]|eukprot:XP_012197192.1 hypothetical protein SPRG_03215 [Saprolegnia parasitica CBS 223.65]